MRAGDPNVMRLPFPQHMKSQALNERQLIKAFCEERKIIMLVHFTRLENLAGILREGLVCRKELEARPKSQRPFFSDLWRHKWYERANCLSISFPNDLMFCRYQRKYPSAKWVVLKIKASVLWELDCAFCFKNAWSNEVRRSGISSLGGLKSYDSFVGLFSQWSGKYPVDVQAEILVFNRIEFPEFIEWVYFKSQEDRSYWKSGSGDSINVPSSVEPSFFGFRNAVIQG